MPRRLPHAWTNWRVFDDPKYVQKRATCLLCGKTFLASATRQLQHEEQCNPEIATLQQLADEPPKRKKQKRVQVAPLPDFMATNTNAEQEKQLLDLLCARVVVKGDLPLSLFEGEDMQRLVSRLKPGYAPPSRRKIVQELIPAIYEEAEAKVDDNNNNGNQGSDPGFEEWEYGEEDDAEAVSETSTHPTPESHL